MLKSSSPVGKKTPLFLKGVEEVLLRKEMQPFVTSLLSKKARSSIRADSISGLMRRLVAQLPPPACHPTPNHRSSTPLGKCHFTLMCPPLHWHVTPLPRSARRWWQRSTFIPWPLGPNLQFPLFSLHRYNARGYEKYTHVCCEVFIVARETKHQIRSSQHKSFKTIRRKKTPQESRSRTERMR